MSVIEDNISALHRALPTDSSRHLPPRVRRPPGAAPHVQDGGGHGARDQDEGVSDRAANQLGNVRISFLPSFLQFQVLYDRAARLDRQRVRRSHHLRLLVPGLPQEHSQNASQDEAEGRKPPGGIRRLDSYITLSQRNR